MESEKLNQVFTEPKETIIDAIRSGVQIFNLGKLTCLRPDWLNMWLLTIAVYQTGAPLIGR